MVRKIIAASAALMTLFAASANAQQTTHNPADLRCAVVGLTLAGTAGGNAQQQQAGTLIALYYLGRVQGAEPAVDIEALLRRETTALTAATLDAERVRCATEFAAMGQSLMRMGQSMQSDAAPQ